MIDKVVACFREKQDNNIIYTYRNEEENKDVTMVALREMTEVNGYYEKHEYRKSETVDFISKKKKFVKEKTL